MKAALSIVLAGLLVMVPLQQVQDFGQPLGRQVLGTLLGVEFPVGNG